MGQGESKPKPRRSTKVSAFGGNLNLEVRSTSVLPSFYKVKSPPIARGPFGEIREAFHTQLKEKYLMKIIFKTQFSEQELIDIQEEYYLMKELKHPNIMEVIDFHQDERFFFIILQFFKGRPLFDKVREEGGIKSEYVAAKILHQLAKTMEFIHKKNIVVRNLKLENILYNGRQIMLHDFNAAVHYKGGKKLLDLAGPIRYAAPEVIKGSYDQRADIWSFGVVAYIMIFGQYPFVGRDDAAVSDAILKCKVDTQSEFPKSQNAIDFIKKILVLEPEMRMNWHQISEHQFFKTANDREKESVKIMFQQVKHNLLNFHNELKVQLLIFLHFVHKYYQNVEGSNISKEIFMKMDTKATGKISVKEFREFCVSNDLGLREPDIEGIIRNIDKDKSGSIEYEEFNIGCIDRAKLLTEEKIRTYFTSLVPEGSEYLSIQNLRELFVSIKVEDFEEFFVNNGVDINGAFTVDTFIKMMKRLI